MRFFFYLLILCGCAASGWMFMNHYPETKIFYTEAKSFVGKKINPSEFQTLEIRYSAEQIMDTHRREFLKNERYSFLEPKLVFYPYVLMEIKYAKDDATTEEGLLLFGLNDGEMVLNGKTWEKTHGFKDCLIAKASSDDFNILRPLVEAGGYLEKDILVKLYKGQPVEKWIQSCKTKKLIVINGSKVRLHFDKPIFSKTPITRLEEKGVSYPAKSDQKISSNFSISEIISLATSAFGQDFAVLQQEEVYLPVYCISVQNPDGSILSTAWNALTGQRIN